MLAVCPICSAKLSININNEFNRCNSCKALIRRKYDLEKLRNQYQTAWNNPLKNMIHTGATDIELANSYASNLLKSLKLSTYVNVKILDFGAGRGELSSIIANQGAIVTSIDPYSYELLREKGIKAFPSLEDINEQERFDGIVCVDVIEHLHDPIYGLSKLHSFLKEDGWFYISTPNSESLNARVTRNRWRELNNPGYLILFTHTCLQYALLNTGFKEIKRLIWNVVYNKQFLSRIKNWFLLSLKLDGELRFLAYKR